MGAPGYLDYDGLDGDVGDDYYARGMNDMYDRSGMHESFGPGLMDTYGRGINDTMFTEESDPSGDYETLLMERNEKSMMKRKVG